MGFQLPLPQLVNAGFQLPSIHSSHLGVAIGFWRRFTNIAGSDLMPSIAEGPCCFYMDHQALERPMLCACWCLVFKFGKATFGTRQKFRSFRVHSDMLAKTKGGKHVCFGTWARWIVLEVLNKLSLLWNTFPAQHQYLTPASWMYGRMFTLLTYQALSKIWSPTLKQRHLIPSKKSSSTKKNTLLSSWYIPISFQTWNTQPFLCFWCRFRGHFLPRLRSVA